jgi:hypothetical protein
MPIVNARSNQFIFRFPKGWFPKQVTDKWDPYVLRLPVAFESTEAIMTYSIQSVTFPTITMDAVAQTRRLGKQQEYKNSKPIQDLFNREITVTFRLLEGHVNYFVMLDTVLCYLNFDDDQLYMDEMYLQALDQEGHVVNTVRFDKVYFKNMSEINLAYSDNNPDFKSFSVTFGFNWMEIFVQSS